MGMALLQPTSKSNKRAFFYMTPVWRPKFGYFNQSVMFS